MKPQWWLEHLRLAKSDQSRLMNGQELTDAIMNASQQLLAYQFPECRSLQDVSLGCLLMFQPVYSTDSECGPNVQILYTGKLCQLYLASEYDAYKSKPVYIFLLIIN